MAFRCEEKPLSYSVLSGEADRANEASRYGVSSSTAIGIRGGVAPVLAAFAVGTLMIFGLLFVNPSLSDSRLATARPLLLPVKDGPGGVGAPLAKQVVVGMDTNINFHTAWNDWDAWHAEMAPYWTEDMVYDFAYVGEWNFGPTKGLINWYKGEHLHFNGALPDCQWMDFIRAANQQNCTSASYGLARWVAPFAGVPPPVDKPHVTVRDLDFYLLEGDRIKVNWCIIDVANLFSQVGYNVLPPAPMSTDGYLAPSAMDGFPAPLSAAVVPDDTRRSEEVWRSALHEDFELRSAAARWWAHDVVWYGPGGIGTAHSRKEYSEHFLEPLYKGFDKFAMHIDSLVCEGKYCGAHFYLWGTHTGTWLGEPASGRTVPIRCGAHARIEGGQIVQGWLIIDIPRAFHGMGVDFYKRARELAEIQAGLSSGRDNLTLKLHV